MYNSRQKGGYKHDGTTRPADPLQCKLFYANLNIDKRIRIDHPLRKIDQFIDFNFVSKEVKDKYGPNGNVSVPPPLILKLMLLLVFYNVRSERELMDTLPERLDWLWFLGYDLDTEIPNHSVLSKARKRWGVEIFKGFFERIVWQCVEAGLVDDTLIARFFMYKTVYYHKTTFGLEEVMRQLIRRMRDTQKYKLPSAGKDIKELASDTKLLDFTDGYLDAKINQATKSKDKVISTMAHAISRRQPPRLLKEVSIFIDRSKESMKHNAGITFRRRCQNELTELARKHKIPLELFLYCETKPLTLEKRGSSFTFDELQDKDFIHDNEIIRVFLDKDEPENIMDIPYSLLNVLSNKALLIHRLYLVAPATLKDNKLQQIKTDVNDWDS